MRWILVALSFTLGGCATLVGGGSSQGVTVASTPSGATFRVKASSGLEMASGAAPQTFRLPRKNEYQVEFTAPGYQPRSLVVMRGINGWLFGNFIFGWIPGLIIDFVSGAAYKLEPAQLTVALERPNGQEGSNAAFAVVRFMDERGRVLFEQRMELTPTR